MRGAAGGAGRDPEGRAGESCRGSCLERDLLGRFILLAWDYEAQHVFLDFSRQVMSPTEAALKLPVAWRLCTRGMV